MKKTIALILVVAAALQVAATDRFYIEDFSINPGETKTVSIMLNNEQTYTAFQANLYFPAGLSVAQEDGNYLIDLTERKGRDHTISSKMNADGSIFIMSYSIGVKPFKENSGALVAMSITADESFTAPVSVGIRNILFTTQNGDEVSFEDETCNVSTASTNQLGDVNSDGEVDVSDVTAIIQYILTDNGIGFNFEAANVDGLGDIDVGDVTALIVIILNR